MMRRYLILGDADAGTPKMPYVTSAEWLHPHPQWLTVYSESGRESERESGSARSSFTQSSNLCSRRITTDEYEYKISEDGYDREVVDTQVKGEAYHLRAFTFSSFILHNHELVGESWLDIHVKKRKHLADCWPELHSSSSSAMKNGGESKSGNGPQNLKTMTGEKVGRERGMNGRKDPIYIFRLGEIKGRKDFHFLLLLNPIH